MVLRIILIIMQVGRVKVFILYLSTYSVFECYSQPPLQLNVVYCGNADISDGDKSSGHNAV
jgi:hypothetical protein